ncbi:MarR family transcriptional regulator [Acinetobacter sp. ANC 4558]|uniref:MarR family winged helix-turn-helix transcriptional regulator n=1 Tax=Acinetobacter sp. ANC 4558 TaxID=1977876 RepID=UPI000A32C366|nr:MarR family winged helix-turn-helix transcriptional regulator [Acinetobacter sp. ANC 4558]OTG87650.1 MarR family transcriptional regulator [Acinetobacter sp. ANC 4558]
MSQSEHKYVIEEQIGYLLRRVYYHHLSIFQQSLDETRLTSVQFAVLYAINKLQECSQKELIEDTGIDQATIRGIIQRLKDKHLISQDADLNDKRKVLIHITTQGKAELDLAIPIAETITDTTLKALNPAEKVALQFLLKKILSDK